MGLTVTDKFLLIPSIPQILKRIYQDAENAVILPRMAAFSCSCSMADFATGMPLKFRENRLYNRDVWCYTIKDVLCAD